MDFEPFHSDEDEELASIMPEKKKKDGEKWKKSKGGPLFRNEKKMTYNDIHSPPGVKGKHSVHGVVGPAEYICDQASPPAPEPIPTLLSQALTHSSTVVTSNEIHSMGPTHVNPSTRGEMIIPPPVTNAILAQKPPARPDLSQQPSLSQAQQKQVYSNLHSSQTQFHANFPPVSSLPPKIDRDRPHVSPAVLPQIPQVPQGPTPFKHPPQANVQVRPSLLSQTMTAAQFQQPSQQPPMQVTAGNHTSFQRNQAYNMTVSASKPIPIPEPHTTDFTATYENVCDRSLNSSQDSSVGENAESITRGSISSPPMSPFGNDVVVEGSWPQLEGKVPAPHEYIDSEWATFHPAVSLQDPYDGDNDDNRRKSHGTDSLSESIPESMSSVESEQDDSVWKINTEQREYYTKQFRKIQPNIGEVIKGPQARDFFLKSNLPNETLSTIWQLSDMDKDAALNLNEFCIAMHLVVAVKHGVDLPTILPQTLIHPSGSFSEEPLCEEVHQGVADVDSEDENKNSSISDDASLSSSTEASSSNLVSDNIRRSSLHDLENRDRSSSFGTDAVDGSVSVSGSMYNTPIKDSVTAIARPRASVQKNVNLMDSSPYQLLPPPSSKGKPVVKKLLNMDDDAAFTSNESIEQVNSFSSPEQLTKDLSSVFTDNDNEYDNRTSNSQTKTKPRRLSKEKSRSIDSLRLDMNEDHASVEMRRMSRDSRPRSFSGEGTHVNGSATSNRVSKEMEIPPIPPPRNKGHVRANSLDLNRIIDPKTNSFSGSQEIPSAAFRHTPSSLDSSDVSLAGHTRQDVANGGIKLDGSNLNIDSKEIHSQSSTMAHSPIRRGSAGGPRRGSAGDPVKHVVRFSDELDVLDDVTSSNSIDKKMRKHELQARVRLLKSSNSTLNNLLTQLHMEWKSVAEERIALDILLQKEKQQDLS